MRACASSCQPIRVASVYRSVRRVSAKDGDDGTWNKLAHRYPYTVRARVHIYIIYSVARYERGIKERRAGGRTRFWINSPDRTRTPAVVRRLDRRRRSSYTRVVRAVAWSPSLYIRARPRYNIMMILPLDGQSDGRNSRECARERDQNWRGRDGRTGDTGGQRDGRECYGLRASASLHRGAGSSSRESLKPASRRRRKRHAHTRAHTHADVHTRGWTIV